MYGLKILKLNILGSSKLSLNIWGSAATFRAVVKFCSTVKFKGKNKKEREREEIVSEREIIIIIIMIVVVEFLDSLLLLRWVTLSLVRISWMHERSLESLWRE